MAVCERGVYVPSCLKVISVSSILKSSDVFVLTSPPMRSPAHCLNRSSFLLTFIVAVM